MAYYERNLPHWQPEGRLVFVTWRLHGTLPPNFLNGLGRNKVLSGGRRFVAYDRYLDASKFGPHWLADGSVAEIVVQEIGELRKDECEVKSYVVMPNHVHLLLRTRSPLCKIMQRLKGRSAARANRLLGRTGMPFWQDESFDHWVRDGAAERTVRYILNNPATAGLVNKAEDWPWSSTSGGWRVEACTD